MVSLPAFTVRPKKTFLGLDKSEGHCFTMKKALYPVFIEKFQLSASRLQTGIVLVHGDLKCQATLRLINQNKSRPSKLGIARKWPERQVLQIGWKGQQQTIGMFREGLDDAYLKLSQGLRNTTQIVNFEHLGSNEFYVSFVGSRV